MKKLAIAAAACAAATALLAQAQQQPKPEDHIKWRKAAYSLMGLHFGSLAAMAQDKKPYNKEQAIRDADFVALVSTEPRLHFGEGTDLGDTKAKPEIWKKRADFDQKMDKMVNETSKLPQVARNGDLAALKKAVADTGGACKSCHDDYRAK